MHVPCAGPLTGACRRFAGPPLSSPRAAPQDKAILLPTGKAGQVITSVVVVHPLFHKAAS
jgi:hypothetical protein